MSMDIDDDAGSSRLLEPPSPSSPVNHLGEMGSINQNHVARQLRAILGSEPITRDAVGRKRKRTHSPSHSTVIDRGNVQEDGDIVVDDAESQSRRRIRPRLHTRQNGEFSPLLSISPSQERDPLEEETISAFHYPHNVVNSSGSIQRYFHLGNPREHDLMQRSDLPPAADYLEDHHQHGYSDSVNSFTELVLASTVTPTTDGRLSTLQDFELPCPFEETERPPMSIIKVHERGLDSGPLFPSANSGRTSDVGAPREHASNSSRSRSPMAGPSAIKFFDKPLCESPDSISPTEDGLSHVEPHTTQVPRPHFS